MSCRHKNVVVVGSHETGASSARCSNCRAPLTRRIEGGEYIYYVAQNGEDNARGVSVNRKARP